MTYLDKIRAAEAPSYRAGYSFICIDCGAIYPLRLIGCPACGSRTRENAAKVHGDVRAEILGPPRLKIQPTKPKGAQSERRRHYLNRYSDQNPS